MAAGVSGSLRHDVASLYHLWHLANGFGTTEALTPDKICSFCYPFKTTELSSCPWFKFPNSLIIHIENSKEINVLWKSDEKLLIFASLISPSKITFVWEVISSIPHSVSLPDDRMKHLKVRQKYFAARRIFLTTRSDNETLRHMLDTAVSRKVVGKSARDNPERYCGCFCLPCSPKKFERMAREATDICSQVLVESNKSRFDSYSR